MSERFKRDKNGILWDTQMPEEVLEAQEAEERRRRSKRKSGSTGFTQPSEQELKDENSKNS